MSLSTISRPSQIALRVISLLLERSWGTQGAQRSIRPRRRPPRGADSISTQIAGFQELSSERPLNTLSSNQAVKIFNLIVTQTCLFGLCEFVRKFVHSRSPLLV